MSVRGQNLNSDKMEWTLRIINTCWRKIKIHTYFVTSEIICEYNTNKF